MASKERLALLLGMLLLIGGLAGIGLTNAPSDVSAHESTDKQASDNTDDSNHQRSPAHERMHEMMDSMMGEGATERMHEAMPGSEQMMEACANSMGAMMHGDNTMDNMDEMMPNDNMMDGGGMMNRMGEP